MAADERFVAPVEVDAVAEVAVRALEREFAADRADARVRQQAQQGAQRAGFDALAHVGEQHDVGIELGDDVAEAGRLAAPHREYVRAQARVGALAQYRRGVVLGAVGCDVEAQAIGRIVERGEVLQLGREFIGGIVRDDDHVDARLPLGRLHAPRAIQRTREHREWIAEVGPGEGEETEQEDPFHRASPWRPSRCPRQRS